MHHVGRRLDVDGFTRLGCDVVFTNLIGKGAVFIRFVEGERAADFLDNINLYASSQSQYQVERRLLLNVVVGQRPAVFQLFACEYQALLIGWNALFLLYLLLDVLDGVVRLHLECDSLSSQRPDEDLHCRGWHGQQHSKHGGHYRFQYCLSHILFLLSFTLLQSCDRL